MAEALVEAVNDDAERRRRGDARLRGGARPLLVAGARARARARVRRGRGEPAEPPSAGCSRPTAADALLSSTGDRSRTGSGARTERAARASSSTADGVEVVVPRRFALRHVEPVRGGEAALDRAHAARACARPRRSCRRAAGGRRRGALPGRAADASACASSPGARATHVARRGDGSTWRWRAGREPVREALERWYRRRARAEVAPASTRPAPARARATRRSRSAASARAGRPARRAAR